MSIDCPNSKAEQAKKLFCEGYNCAQSVVLAFQEELGVDPQTLAKLSSSFGGGMGRLREVCGAVSGMFMVMGLLYGYSDPLAKAEKTAHYKLIQDLAGKFKAANGSIICRELLGGVPQNSFIPEDRTADYYKKRPCKDLVYFAAQMIEQFIEDSSAEG